MRRILVDLRVKEASVRNHGGAGGEMEGGRRRERNMRRVRALALFSLLSYFSKYLQKHPSHCLKYDWLPHTHSSLSLIHI